MKKRRFGKAVLLSLLSLGSLALSGCSSFIEQDAAVGIAGISTRTLDDGNTEITITYTDEDKDPSVFIVSKGNDGNAGNGIQSITYEENDDGSINVTIAFTNKGYDNQTFTIPAATSISEITTTTDEETGDVTMTIHFSDGSDPKSFVLPRGKDGEDGVGIDQFTCTKDDKTGDVTIHIALTDGKSADYKIVAARGIESVTGITDENGNYVITVEYTDENKEPDTFTLDGPTKWWTGEDKPNDEIGKPGDFYIDEDRAVIYQKEGDENSSHWVAKIYLKESEKPITVTFDLNDSDPAADGAWLVSGSKTYTLPKGSNFYSYKKLDLPVPARKETSSQKPYTFAGWWAGTDFNNVNVGQFTNLTTVYSDITVYAKWIAPTSSGE